MAEPEAPADVTEEETPEEVSPDTPLTPFVEEVTDPISADSPTGDKVTYDEDFQQMQAEIDKLSTAAADSVDFGLVIKIGRKILKEKSKDVRVAVFLTMALYRQNQYKGLAEGLQVVRIMSDTFWDLKLYPKKTLARRLNIKTLADRIRDWLGDDKPRPADEEALSQVIQQAEALAAFCKGKEGLDDENRSLELSLSSFQKAIRQTLGKIPKKPEPTAVRPTPVARPAGGGAAPTPASAGAPAGGMTTSDIRSSTQAYREVLKLADFLRAQDATDPVAYSLARTAQWGQLTQEPPNDGGKTLMEPPPAPRRSYLEGLLPQNNQAMLVSQGETSFQEPPYHFWLDLQRLQATALEGMGPQYRPVYEAVLHQTALLMQRLPGLAKLSFKDGTPFASPMTQEWLDGDVATALGGSGGGSGFTMRIGSAHLEDQYEEVRKIAGRGDLQAALAAMQEGREQDTTSQDRFLRDLYVAELCVRGGAPAIARPMLEALEETVMAHQLSTWEPALALRVWSSLHRCYTFLADDDEGQEAPFKARAQEVFGHVCRVDAAYALATLGA